MKRFWRDVAVTPDLGVALDGRPVRTPGRVALALPTPALAEALAAEWRGVGDTVDPRAMPLTGLANAAIDRIAPDRQAFAAGLARYGESDLLYYRAESPADLVARQEATWDPVLAWVRRRYDVHFEPTSGVMPHPQPAATVARLAEATAALDAWTLAPLSPLVTLSGSLLLALALVEGELDPDQAWTAAHVDEAWQAEQWGDDPLAADRRAHRRREFDAAVLFWRLGPSTPPHPRSASS